MAENDNQLQLLREISDSLHQLVRLTRVMSHPMVKEMLETVLDTEEKRLVYHSLDGTRGMSDIQELTGVNARYVSEWGQEWEKLGIAEPSSVSNIRGRRQKSFDLVMFGISVPEIDTDKTDDVGK